MSSVFRNAVIAIVALTCNLTFALSVHEELRIPATSEAIVQKSNVVGYEKMIQVDSNDDKLFLHWNLSDDELDVRVVFKGLVWLGFGILSSDGSLERAEAVIGKPDKPQRNQVREYRFSGDKWTQAMKMSVGSQTLKDRSLVQDGTYTTLSFRKPLKEDSKEIASVNRSGKKHFLLAVGEENLFSNPQRSYTLTIDFSNIEESVEKTSGSQKGKEESREVKNKASEFSAKKISRTQNDRYSTQRKYILTASLVSGVSLLALMLASLRLAKDHQQEIMQHSFERDSDNIFYQI